MKLQGIFDAVRLTPDLLGNLIFEVCPGGSALYEGRPSDVGLRVLEKLEVDGLITWDRVSDKGNLAKTFNSTTVGFALFQVAGGQNYGDYGEAMRWVDVAQFIIDRLTQEGIIS